MRLLQATTTPQAPQAPAAPPAPSHPPTPEQAQTEIHEQVRKAVEDAKSAARQARDQAQRVKDQAQQAKAQGLPAPVIAGPGESTTGMPPIDWPRVQQMGENISYAFFLSIVAIAIGVPLARAFARRLGPAPVAPPLPAAVADQLRRIEQTVESMAVEIERISESQRFLTKLGAGKAEAASFPPRAGA